MALFGRSKAPSAPADPHGLDRVLIQFSESDPWRIRDACEGTHIFGATGSGKTSGSGQAIAKSFLRAGFGGLVLTAKPDERALWERYCQLTGRQDSLIVFSPEQPWRFNFLDYEYRRPGPGSGQTESLVRLFHNVLEVGEGQKHRSADSFWDQAVKQMLRNAIDLLIMSGRGVALADLQRIIRSAPTGAGEADSERWQNGSFCFKCLEDGGVRLLARKLDSIQSHDFDEVVAPYWLNDFPTMDDRTRSNIVASFTAMADGFVRGTLRDLFCTTTNLIPEHTHLGHVVVLDLPVKTWGDMGRFAQVVFKYLWQLATERRDVNQNPRPVFLWADEAQFFLTGRDKDFQTTARSSRACTVFLSQNLPTYYAMLSGPGGKSEVDSLLGNLTTKIFHANDDHTTNQWAAERIGKARHAQTSFTSGEGGSKGGASKSSTYSTAMDLEVQPGEFMRLRKGGPDSKFHVEALMFQAGRIWNQSGKPYLKCFFGQNQ